MKKIYEKPEIEISAMEVEDIITTSSITLNAASQAAFEDGLFSELF